jgi:signal peptidase II
MSSEPAPDDDRRPPRRGLLLIVVAAIVLAADVLTKIAVVSALEGERPVRLLGGAVYLQLVRNPGAAFSMATGMTWVLTLIAVAVVCAIIWIMPKLRSVGWAIGLSLVLAGALGNLSDRFFRAPGPLRGHVVDFVSLFAPNGDVWPVFNVADSAIVVGGCLVVVMALLGREYDGRSTKALSKAGPVEPKAEEPS